LDLTDELAVGYGPTVSSRSRAQKFRTSELRTVAKLLPRLAKTHGSEASHRSAPASEDALLLASTRITPSEEPGQWQHFGNKSKSIRECRNPPSAINLIVLDGFQWR
jgi:hypothetical protein